MSKQTLILDSSQLSVLGECEERWRLENQENLIHIRKDLAAPGMSAETLSLESNRPNDPIAAGSLGHKYLEIYYRSLGLTQDQTLACRDALAFDPDAADFVDEHQYPLKKELKAQVRSRFTEYLMTYAARDYEVSRKRSPSICVSDEGELYDCYVYTPLIEQGFSYHLYEDSQYLFILEGKIDFIGETNGTRLWMDHKWQFRERELYRKSIQFRNYALATGLDLGIINYVRLHKEVNPKTTFVRQPISFSAYERRCWKEELISLFMGYAHKLRDSDLKQNFSACGGKFGYICEFTPLCEEWNPATREAIKARDFTTRKEWLPWT